MMPIIPKFVHDFAQRTDLRLNRAQRQHLEQYLTALLVCDNQTVASLDGWRKGEPGSDSVNRLLREYPWDDHQMEEVRNQLVQEAVRRKGGQAGVLIMEAPLVDFPILPAPDNGTGGRRLLTTCQVACEPFHVPLDFELQRPAGPLLENDPQDKASAVKALFGKGLKRDIPFSMVWMDTWFLCKETVDFLEANHHFPYVAAVHKDFKVLLRNSARTLSDYARSLPGDVFKTTELATSQGQRRPFLYASKKVRLASVGEMRLVIAYDARREEREPRFLVTNQLNWEIEWILWEYSQRWFVERYYQGSPHTWGAGDSLGSPLGMEWQLRMIFMAESLFQLNAQVGPLTEVENRPRSEIRI